MVYLFILDCAVLMIGIVMGILRCQTSIEFVKNDKAEEEYNGGYDNVVLIIPIYNEQEVIEKSFFNFLPMMKQGIKIIYVGTQKEKSKIKTYDLLKQLVDQNGMNQYCDVLIFPRDDGVMAHQLNYALQQIDDEVIVGIYNVDSVIGINTINYVLKNQYLLKHGVLQQYSYSEYCSEGVIVDGIKWQNRWSLSYELPRTIKQYEFGIEKFNYVIGHGLFFKKEIMNGIGLFSEKQINEDNVLGYELKCNDINIYPIPFLEKIDFADNLQIYVKQQAVWFNGPLYAFRYMFEKWKKQTFKWKHFVLACKNYKNAINWCAFEMLTIVLLLFFSVNHNFIFTTILLLETIAYVFVPNYMSEKILVKNEYLDKHDNANIVLILRQVFFWLCIHSMGPIITIIKIVLGKNNQKNKYKTEKSISI